MPIYALYRNITFVAHARFSPSALSRRGHPFFFNVCWSLYHAGSSFQILSSTIEPKPCHKFLTRTQIPKVAVSFQFANFHPTAGLCLFKLDAPNPCAKTNPCRPLIDQTFVFCQTWNQNKCARICCRGEIDFILLFIL